MHQEYQQPAVFLASTSGLGSRLVMHHGFVQPIASVGSGKGTGTRLVMHHEQPTLSTGVLNCKYNVH